ncbi:hypothetical protein [Roseisalinus antarcticus]|uniref:Plant Basic Secretory Protein n=1 Tax=Roseisalinus antarcticus TaxID=254357 RepID=A0A1Y5SSP6_9RHOB|nr:hypothetical protein [Roseisalinus antarcticus]SLN47526.1 hypothetical protein ROA7023_02005 [Roseisalinus antarcticus]
MRLALFVIPLLLTACARPLTPAEQVFGAQLVGETAASDVRILSVGPVGAFTFTYPVRPATTCRERILPAPEGPTFEATTAGVVLWDHILTNPDWYLDDYLGRWPEQMNLVAAMFFAHELTHVWQWQNRETTGFFIGRVAAEHNRIEDPYLFDSDALPRFLDYGFEAQSSLVEEYVCCAAVAPRGARTKRLKALLAQAMPLGDWRPPRDVLLPDTGVDLGGICD